MRENKLELAAEYLLMAAMMIEIKSRMLLPRPPGASTIEEDPRAELVRRLLEYEQMKKAAQRVGEIPVAGRDYMLSNVLFERDDMIPPDVTPIDLKLAWLTILNRAKVHQHHKITREQLSVRSHMIAPPAGRGVCGVHAVIQRNGRQAGAGSDVYRAAGTGARIAGENHAGASVRADLRQTEQHHSNQRGPDRRSERGV
jgi:hypothetical protein